MVGRILASKNLKSLMRSLKTELPIFFNFNNIQMMFHDSEKKCLYSLTDGDYEEIVNHVKMKKSLANSQAEIEVIDAIKDINEMMINSEHMILVPISTGIGTLVFKN